MNEINTRKTLFLIYLAPSTAERWSFLRNFYHPPTMDNERKILIVSFDIDISHFSFLRLDAKNFASGGYNTIIIPYSMVEAMIEIPFGNNPIGFFQSQEEFDDLCHRKNDP